MNTVVGEIEHKDWNIKKVEECCEILDNQRIPLNAKTRKTIKGEIPYYGANGIVDYINQWIFNEPLILMAEDGGYFGEFRDRPIAYYVDGKCWVNNHAHILRVINGHNFKWIFYQLEHANVLPFINGSTRTKLNQSDLRKLKLAIPPLTEQRKIAEILSTVDEAIEKTDAIIKETQQLKKGLMQKFFVNKAFMLWSKAEKENTKITPIRLNAFGKIVTGTTPSTKNKEYYNALDFMFIGPADLGSNKNITKSIKYISKEGLEVTRKLNKGAVMVVCIGATIGKVGITTKLCATNQQINTIIPKSTYPSEYVYYLLTGISQYLLSFAGDTATPILNKCEFGKVITFIHDDKNERSKISSILSNLDSKIEKEKETKNELEKLKKGLMQVLLTGKVRAKV